MVHWADIQYWFWAGGWVRMVSSRPPSFNENIISRYRNIASTGTARDSYGGGEGRSVLR